MIADLARPLPMRIIADLLGLPAEVDFGHLQELSRDVTDVLEPIASVARSQAILDAADELERLVRMVIDHKRSHPRDDLISWLVHESDLDVPPLVDNITFLLLAGHETTVNLIGNGVLSLLQHPREFDRLRSEPQLDRPAMDELLRYESPVQFARRVATAPLEIGATKLAPGSFLLIGLAAANRDPEQFGTDADQLRIGRSGVQHHRSFGAGVHGCLGSAMASSQAATAIGTLIRRHPELALVDEAPTWRERLVLRGLEHLIVDTNPPASPHLAASTRSMP